jgi:hypothetical protein
MCGVLNERTTVCAQDHGLCEVKNTRKETQTQAGK